MLYEKFYLTSFKKLLDTFQNKTDLKVLYPSTSFINKPKLNFELYTSAKLDGEKLCKEIMEKNNHIQIFYPRMEALQTDLTSSFFQKKMPDTAYYMSEILKIWVNNKFN